MRQGPRRQHERPPRRWRRGPQRGRRGYGGARRRAIAAGGDGGGDGGGRVGPLHGGDGGEGPEGGRCHRSHCCPYHRARRRGCGRRGRAGGVVPLRLRGLRWWWSPPPRSRLAAVASTLKGPSHRLECCCGGSRPLARPPNKEPRSSPAPAAVAPPRVGHRHARGAAVGRRRYTCTATAAAATSALATSGRVDPWGRRRAAAALLTSSTPA
ncbi:hypothetical protein I4F81_008072 [Pyropia yezoensis]|uniref:Uncharacterized protein n=1 Tax=Pyropia yezoensis TaxID=2788 RepID=A0ACC3C6W9_PYRYE|nr:hypothetical protein I4F81_008072 [Neopyropia yezoensis]